MVCQDKLLAKRPQAPRPGTIATAHIERAPTANYVWTNYNHNRFRHQKDATKSVTNISMSIDSPANECYNRAHVPDNQGPESPAWIRDD
jgi:hypothetical protein